VTAIKPIAAGDVALQPFTADDLPAAHALTAGFEWPHRLDDWAFMSRLGWGIAAKYEGRLVGTALAWLYGAHHASLGLVGVSPALQGQGLGRRLIQAVLDGLGDRNVILHATQAGLPLYRSLGFVEGGTVQQHQGAAFQARLVPLAQGQRLRPIGRSDPAVLAALDQAATGQQRDELLSALLDASSSVVLDHDGAAAGFALLRRFGFGHVIGPVVAPTQVAAQGLISHFLGQHAGQFIRIDVPETAGLSTWLQQLGLGGAGPAIRMTRGTPPRTSRNGVASYALVSQAFG
jgi:GNAT superfamily N-acetyltransferase